MPKQLYTKEKILSDCLRVFAENGYEKTSVVMLAKAAGISRTLILHHFKSKKDLYLKIVDDITKEAEIVLKPVFSTDDYFTAREEFSRSKFSFIKNKPTYYCIVREIMNNPAEEVKEELIMRFGKERAKYQKEWSDLFDKVALKDGVDRTQAYEFVQIAFTYFDDKYFSISPKDNEFGEDYYQKFLKERNSFLEMLRFGIQDKGGKT